MNFKEKVGWPFQKKLGNVLGIKYDQLMPEAQQNEGRLACGDYDAFWHLMNQSEDVREQFCVDLLKSLLTRMQSDEILNDKDQRAVSNAMVNTVNMLSCCDFLVANKRIQKHIKRFADNRRILNANQLPHAKEVLRALQKKVVDGVVPIDSMLLDCCTLHNHNDFNKLGDRFRFPVLRRIVDGDWTREGAYIFVWSAIQRLAADAKYTDMIYEFILKEIRAIRGKKMVSEPLAELSLLALTHMCKYILPIAASTPQKLQNIFNILLPYQFWPSPFCECVNDVLTDIRQELCAPGISFLSIVLKELNYPSLILTDPNTSTRTKYRPIYYLVDSTDPHSKRKQSVMCMQNDFVDDGTLVYERGVHTSDSIGVIATFLRRNGGLSAEERSRLSRLSEESCTQILENIIKGMETACDGEIGNTISQETIQEVRSRIRSCNDDSRNVVPDTYKLPEFMHIALPMTTKMDYPSQIKIVEGSWMFPVNDAVNFIIGKLKCYSQLVEDEQKLTAKFVVAGGNTTLHFAITAFAALQRDHADIAQNFDIRFYLVPFRPCLLCGHLARHDSWYSRHVFVPFHAKNCFFPHYDQDQPVEHNELRTHLPGQNWRHLVETYVTQANHILPVKIWEVQVWTNELQGGAPDRILVFGEVLSLGKEPNQHYFQREKAAVPQVPMLLKLSCSHVDFEGNPWYEQNYDVKDFNLVRCANVTQGEATPDPLSPFLDLYVLPDDTRRGRKASKANAHYRVNALDIKSENGQPFALALDGVLYGLYHRIRVTPLQTVPTADGEAPRDIEFPVATYFPITPQF